MIATKNEHEDIIRYLVEKGSDVNYQKQVWELKLVHT